MRRGELRQLRFWGAQAASLQVSAACRDRDFGVDFSMRGTDML